MYLVFLDYIVCLCG